MLIVSWVICDRRRAAGAKGKIYETVQACDETLAQIVVFRDRFGAILTAEKSFLLLLLQFSNQ